MIRRAVNALWRYGTFAAGVGFGLALVRELAHVRRAPAAGATTWTGTAGVYRD